MTTARFAKISLTESLSGGSKILRFYSVAATMYSSNFPSGMV